VEWTAPIDAYCERVAQGLFAEPLNALTNLAFFVAAAYGVEIARRERSGSAVWLLACLVGVIGLGSLLFHTFANRWSMLADVAPITIFIYAYFAFALRRFLGLSWPFTALLLGALLATNLAVAVLSPPGLLNGSIGYLPALLAAIAMALVLRSRHHPAYVHLIYLASVERFGVGTLSRSRRAFWRTEGP
jgi:hypothetical protein